MEGEIRVFLKYPTALRPSAWGIEVYEDVTSGRNKEIDLLVGRTTSAKILRA